MVLCKGSNEGSTMSDIDERTIRLDKLKSLRDLGLNPFPSVTGRTHSCHDARVLFDTLTESQKRIVLVGRIRNIRRHGGSAFLILEDGTDRFQIYIKKDDSGDTCFHIVKNLLDIGDFIQVEGFVFQTKTGEKTLHAFSCDILSKALLPLPEQWHGLNDIEIRYRQRYLDLIANPDVRDIFMKRAKIIASLRSYFEQHGFMEVETPILQGVAGGAAARPFVTHHYALDADMYLRVAPELYLKRLIIGGFERVFEFARCFRNEGVDHAHNPEFTQIEAYYAYVDCEFLMTFVEQMLAHTVQNVLDSNTVAYKGTHLAFTTPFQRMTFRESLLNYAHLDIGIHSQEEDLRKEATNRGIDCTLHGSRAALYDELFKVFVRPNLVQPIFITEYPVELSPLAKRSTENPHVTERFQLVADGMEVVNGFSELNDPIDQHERFLQQQKNRELGDEETQGTDMEFVTALEYGMPPTAGFGMGIDRLTALLTNSHSLKEVILFPTLRQKKHETKKEKE